MPRPPKRTTLYLFPHIYKFVVNNYGEDKFFNYRYPMIHFDESGKYHKKLNKKLNKKIAYQCQMYNPHVQNQCVLIELLEKEFFDAFFITINTYNRLGIKVREGVRLFYAEYGITDQDYNVTSAYRAFFRLKNRRQHHLISKQPKDYLEWAA